MRMDYDEMGEFVAAADGHDIRHMLGGALEPVSPLEICDLFTWATISFEIEGEFGASSGYDLARKIRGAMWPQLVEIASTESTKGLACPRKPASLLDILWNDMGRLPRGKDIPKPWVLRATDPKVVASGKPRSLVQLVLFGLASCLCEELADVLAATIEAGLQDGRRKLVLKIIDDEIVIDEGIDQIAVKQGQEVKIDLLSPLKLSADGSASFNYTALLPSLIDRIEGLGLWHGVKLSCDFGELRQKARSIKIDERGTEIGSWVRHSGRTNRLVPMMDTRGTLRLRGDFDQLQPFLTLLPIVHAGKDTRHGHGWCAVSTAREVVRFKKDR